MNRPSIPTLVLTVAFFVFSLVVPSLARDLNYGKQMRPVPQAKPVNPLTGKWALTNNPVDASGNPSPDIPKTIEFFRDGTVMMSNVGDIHMHYKTELTPKEREIFDKRPGLKGNRLLLVRPTSEMAWTATHMVYVYTVTRSDLTLTVPGWPKATYRRSK